VGKDWSPHAGPQTEVLRRSEREIFYGGCRGGGKTEAGLAWLAEPEYIGNSRFSSLVIRKDYEDLQQWVFRAGRFYDGLATISGTPKKIYWKAGGVTVIGHWKDKETLSKYIGQEFHKMLCEEMTQTIRNREEYDMLLGSLRTSIPELKPQFMGNANPGGVGHAWVKAYFVDKCRNQAYVDPITKSSRIFIPSSYKDNPTLIKSDPGYIAWLEGLGGALGKAWREGDWGAFKGQFFSNFGDHLREKSFRLEPKYHQERVFGSLDFGCGQNGISSFGYWFLDEKNVPHRCFTHTSRGMITPSEQAAILRDYIGSFPITSGMYPKKVWYDNSMDVKAGSENDWAAIDYFKREFDRYGVIWIPANKSRVNGWRIMLDYFSIDQRTETAKMKYWEEYNDDFVNTVVDMQSDPNRPDDVEKCEIDHWSDECRYGLVGIRGNLVSSESEKKRSVKNVSDLTKILNEMEARGRLCETGLN